VDKRGAFCRAASPASSTPIVRACASWPRKGLSPIFFIPRRTGSRLPRTPTPRLARSPDEVRGGRDRGAPQPTKKQKKKPFPAETAYVRPKRCSVRLDLPPWPEMAAAARTVTCTVNTHAAFQRPSRRLLRSRRSMIFPWGPFWAACLATPGLPGPSTRRLREPQG